MQPQASSRNLVWNSPVRMFSGWSIFASRQTLNSFANRLSSSRYVDPPSFRVQLTLDTHHPESVPGSVPESVRPGRPGRTHISRIHSNGQPSVAIIQVRRRQGVRQPKVVSGIGLWNAPGNALWNAPVRVFSGWSIYTSPQTLIPSPIDSARRVTSIPRVSASNSQPTPTILTPFPKKRSQKAFGRPAVRPYTHFPNT